MLLNYFGYEENEMEILKICNTSDQNGTNTQQLVSYFQGIGWEVESSLDKEITPSLSMLRNNLLKGIPTLVEWVDFGGSLSRWILYLPCIQILKYVV